MSDKIKKYLKDIVEKIKSDGHMPVALFVFVVTTVIHVATKRDLGANYVSSLYAFYGFLAGHKFVQGKYEDQPEVTQATTVVVDQPKP